jgi:hypothetical protein
MDPCNIDIDDNKNNGTPGTIFCQQQFLGPVSGSIAPPCNYSGNGTQRDANPNSVVTKDIGTVSSSIQNEGLGTLAQDASRNFGQSNDGSHAPSGGSVKHGNEPHPSFYKNLNDALMMDVNSCFLPLLPLFNFHGHRH